MSSTQRSAVTARRAPRRRTAPLEEVPEVAEQFHMLRIAVETRDKIETIRGIVTFLFVLWLIGVVLLIAGVVSSDSTSGGF